MNRLSLLMLAMSLLALPATAATIVLTLDDVPEVDCDAIFMESECALHFTATTAEDEYPGYSLFNVDANNFGKQGVYIWPSRIVLDLTNVEGIEMVEVDVYETDFAGSTRAFVYGDGGGIGSMFSWQEGDQTLMIPVTGETPTSLAVSAHEAYVWEIKLIGDAVAPVDGVSFSAVKALYR